MYLQKDFQVVRDPFFSAQPLKLTKEQDVKKWITGRADDHDPCFFRGLIAEPSLHARKRDFVFPRLLLFLQRLPFGHRPRRF